MAKATITKVVDAQWGNCVQLTNGLIDLLVTLDFGPRVIKGSLVGKENMFFVDPEKKPLGEQLDCFEGQHAIVGGHRLWISPEILPRCYYPDNYPVEWHLEEDGQTAVFTAPVEKVNNIQKIIKITLIEGEPSAQLEHIIKNVGNWEIEFAHWCITMLAEGGKEIIPVAKTETGLLPNRNITLWDYSEMNDERVYWGKDFTTLKNIPGKMNPFKLGVNNEDGWVAYFNKGQVFIKSFDPIEGYYPDNDCTFESYTNGIMLECETLSQFWHLEPGEEQSFFEEWEFYEAPVVPSNDEEEIAKIMAEYIKD